MADDLRSRIDRFVTGLMDEAEACGAVPANVTDKKSSEDVSAPAGKRASLTERVAVLKAATAWWNARDGKRHGSTSEPPEEAEDSEEKPVVVGLITELQRREGKQRRR